jgi:hypothetical protein
MLLLAGGVLRDACGALACGALACAGIFYSYSRSLLLI